jgi:hypothetical protein
VLSGDAEWSNEFDPSPHPFTRGLPEGDIKAGYSVNFQKSFSQELAIEI